jgi:hypothetical protein
VLNPQQVAQRRVGTHWAGPFWHPWLWLTRLDVDPTGSDGARVTTDPHRRGPGGPAQQHLELAANHPKLPVGYTQIATISTDPDDPHTLQMPNSYHP